MQTDSTSASSRSSFTDSTPTNATPTQLPKSASTSSLLQFSNLTLDSPEAMAEMQAQLMANARLLQEREQELIERERAVARRETEVQRLQEQLMLRQPAVIQLQQQQQQQQQLASHPYHHRQSYPPQQPRFVVPAVPTMTLPAGTTMATTAMGNVMCLQPAGGVATAAVSPPTTSVAVPATTTTSASATQDATNVHSASHDIRINPVRYKTKMCRHMTESGTCPFDTRCAFAHSPDELRSAAFLPKNT